MRTGRAAAVAIVAMCVTGCSPAPTTRELAARALTAMGGEARVRGIRHFTMTGGTGSRSQLGQGTTATATETPSTLTSVVETIDLANRRAAFAYEVTTSGGFSQRRREILTGRGGHFIGLEDVGGRPLAVMSPSALFSWGTQNSPATALRRNIVVIALAALTAGANQASEPRTLAGRTYAFSKSTLDDETIGLYFDRDSGLIAAYETLDTESMLGDLPARYLLDEYRSVDEVLLPHRIRIEKGGSHYADVRFSGATINDRAALQVFAIPEAAAAAADAAVTAGDHFSPLTLTALGNGVYFAQAYSHHSLVVEFPSYLAVVEAPYTEAQSRTLVGQLTARFPGKPVRYAAVTHPHFDHTGGVRAMAASGVGILATQGHEKAIRALLTARHTNPADLLGTRRATGGTIGSLSLFDGRKVLAEGDQSLELYAVTGSPHADPMVIAFVPKAGVLFQSDLYFPATGAPATPEALHLLDAVRALDLKVLLLAGGHGGVGPFDELVKAAGVETEGR